MQHPTETKASRRSSPVFFGWYVLLAGTIARIMTSPGQTNTVSVFVEHFITDLGLSRSTVSALYSAGTLLASLALPFWGRQIDRRGTRAIVVIASLAFGLSCIYMASVNSALMLGIAFVALRMLGQGTLSLVGLTAINHWWVRRRGMAMGISGTLLAVAGTGAFPRLAFALESNYGWRTTYVIMGATLIFGMTPVGYFLFRKQPEVYGLEPDGLARAEDTDAARPQPRRAADDWTLKEAMATRPFWLLIFSQGLMSLVGTGILFHLVRIFADNGLEPVVAAQAFAPLALAGAVAGMGGGLLSDRLPARIVLVVALLTQLISALLVQGLRSPEQAYVFGALMGLTSGLAQTFSSIVWANFFGRRHLGSIAGFALTSGVVGAALGPLPFGFIRDIAGSYRPILLAGAGALAVFAVANLFLTQPRRKRRAAA